MWRVGSGVDVHAFAEGVPLWLGGILIPHGRGLAGHSDGDAAIHALIDAQTSTPFELSLGWTVSLDKGSFNGKRALVDEAARGPEWRFMGLLDGSATNQADRLSCGDFKTFRPGIQRNRIGRLPGSARG